MSGTEARLAEWLVVVGDLMDRPLARFPHEDVAAELAATFDVVAVSWNWRDVDGRFGWNVVPAEWGRENLAHAPPAAWYDRHPILQWYAATGDPAAQTADRVPSAIASPTDRAAYAAVVRPVGVHRQLAIPYEMAGQEHRTLVLGRDGDDFSDEDLLVARQLQRVLVALNRHIQIFACLGHRGSRWTDLPLAGLSPREAVVLRLLTEGHTADAIARRLATSPRTVHKHLQRIYRKLEVRDRLAAIRTPTAAWLAANGDPVEQSLYWQRPGPLRAGPRARELRSAISAAK